MRRESRGAGWLPSVLLYEEDRGWMCVCLLATGRAATCVPRWTLLSSGDECAPSCMEAQRAPEPVCPGVPDSLAPAPGSLARVLGVHVESSMTRLAGLLPSLSRAWPGESREMAEAHTHVPV